MSPCSCHCSKANHILHWFITCLIKHLHHLVVLSYLCLERNPFLAYPGLEEQAENFDAIFEYHLCAFTNECIVSPEFHEFQNTIIKPNTKLSAGNLWWWWFYFGFWDRIWDRKWSFSSIKMKLPANFFSFHINMICNWFIIWISIESQ